MKKIKYLFVFIIGVLLFGGCDQEEEISYIFQDISAPTNVQAKFDISQDDTGEVSVTPTAEGATLFEIYFGDTENETPLELSPGETATHIYGEGEFNLRIVAIGMTGLTSELTRIVTISFAAPEDLQVDVTQSGRLEITVTPSATNATVYDIYFGLGEDEEPTTIMDGESASYVYETAGEYTIRVVARGAGVATTETSVTFNVQDLTNAEVFPIDFESNETLTGVFEDTQGVTGTPIANPDASGINTSETVFEFNKAEGAAWYSGIFHIFAEDMDLSEKQQFSLKIWSPKAGINVRFAIEKEGGDAGLNLGIDQTLEVAEEWVTLTYDFTGIVDPSNPYDKFVIFPDFDPAGQPAGDGSIYYIDDITLEVPALELPQLPIDFEAANLDYTWNGFGAPDGSSPIPAGVIANPDASGINTSGNVTFITKPAGSQVWAGASLNLEGPIDFSAGTTIDVKVWSPRAGTPILLKIEDSTSPPDGNNNPSVFAEVQVSTTVAGTWETLSFDMTTFGEFNVANSYDRVILFPDFGTAGQDEDFYFDDIEIQNGDGGGGTSPTQAAPDPTQAQANVINMFSNSYTQDVTVSSWRSEWSSGTLTDIQIEGNDTKEYKGADFVGVEFYGTPVDATTMDFFHVDVWAPEQTVFSVKLVDLGANVEGNLQFDIPTGEWVSLDIPMADFIAAGLTSQSSIQQLIFDGTAGVLDNFDFYIDNVYFYAVPPTSPETAAPDPTEAQVDVINMYSNVYTQDVAVSSWRSEWSTGTLTDILIEGNDTKEYKGADFVGVEFYGTPVDATSMGFFHVDVWSPVQTVFSIKLVDLGANVEGNLQFDIPTGEWVSLDIPMADFIAAGLTSQSSIQQLLFDGTAGVLDNFDFYIDNVYFHN